MKLLPALCLVTILTGLGGCGGDDRVSDAASARLTPHVVAVRAAAERGEAGVALQELASLRQAVTDLNREGSLSDRQAAQVLAAGARVEAELATLPPPAEPTTTQEQATTTTAPVSEDETGDDHEQDDERGRQGKEDRKKEGNRGKD